jgi:hypothetical protein
MLDEKKMTYFVIVFLMLQDELVKCDESPVGSLFWLSSALFRSVISTPWSTRARILAINQLILIILSIV